MGLCRAREPGNAVRRECEPGPLLDTGRASRREPGWPSPRGKELVRARDKALGYLREPSHGPGRVRGLPFLRDTELARGPWPPCGWLSGKCAPRRGAEARGVRNRVRSQVRGRTRRSRGLNLGRTGRACSWCLWSRRSWLVPRRLTSWLLTPPVGHTPASRGLRGLLSSEKWKKNFFNARTKYQDFYNSKFSRTNE